MTAGYAGKILRLDLTSKNADTVPTEKYQQWIGGLGIGIAVFWDEVDKDYITDTHDISGFEPENVLCIMSGPLQGTLAPNGGRCEICGISPEAYPRPQFSRGNMGGTFTPMLKFAGYDGIVIKGAADEPVWVNIQDDKVTFEDANHLWGLDTYETQEEIWREVGSNGYKDWLQTGTSRDAGRTTQRPSVITMGPAGERLARNASLIHEGGRAVGQGGFGGVFGSKNLKAVSVLGTGSVPIARPNDLLESRLWYKQYSNVGRPGSAYSNWGTENFGRALNCYGCDRGCGQNPDTEISMGVQNICVDCYFNYAEDRARNDGNATEATVVPTTYLQRWGVNAYELATGMALHSSAYTQEIKGGVSWLHSLYNRGILGPGKQVECDLDFSQVGTKEFAMELLRRIAYREEIGDDLAEGITRAAAKWGVLEEDLASGLLPQIYWLGEVHWGVQVWWAYASLFQVRDCNRHFLSEILRGGTVERPTATPAEVRAQRLAELVPPYDPTAANLSEEGVYSEGMAHLVAWAQRYSKMYCDSAMMCDWNMPLWFNADTPDGKGLSPEYETRFFNDVTGMDISYEDGLEIGRKIWNFERAILVMHGRHRDEEYFPPFPPYTSYVYIDEEPYLQAIKAGGTPSYLHIVYRDGEWSDENCWFALDKDKMDEFKTKYYTLEGWDTATGWPSRETLEGSGLGFVADELEARGKLPA